VSEQDKFTLPILDVVRPSSHAHSTLVLFLSGISGSRTQWGLVERLIGTDQAQIGYAAPILPNQAFRGAKPTIGLLSRLIAESVDERNYSSVILVAHSVGTFVASAVANRLGKKIAAAIFVNGGLTTVAEFLDRPFRTFVRDPRTCLTALRLFALVGSPAPESLKQSVIRSERSSRALFGNLVSSETLGSAERRRSLMSDSGSAAIPKTLWINRHHWQEFLDTAPSVTADVVFLIGDQDPMSSEADARVMASRMPHARIEVLHGIGHAAPVETAEAVAAAVQEALAKIHG
jgi:pimeloyl-ACP methyl ester carboxylesterase